VLGGEEAGAASELNLPHSERVQRRRADAAEPRCPPCATPTAAVNHQVLPAVPG